MAQFVTEFERLLAERITRLPAFAKVQIEIESAVRDGKRGPGGAAAELARRAWRELD